jgi:maltose O-acetyltransferase
VFLGSNVTILKGVTIGKNSIIGNGSVVTKNIPENVVAAGNPAKFIRNL